MVDHGHRAPQRFLSVPDIHISSEPQKSTKSRSGSKTKLGVSVEVLHSKFIIHTVFLQLNARSVYLKLDLVDSSDFVTPASCVSDV